MESQLNGYIPSCFAVHPVDPQKLAIGCYDGTIFYVDFDVHKAIFEVTAARKLKQSVRRLLYCNDGSLIYSISRNKALCVYDVNSNQRIRCIREAHCAPPCSLSSLSSSSTKGQQLASGDEDGEIRTWDLRAPQPLIASFKDQEDVVNDLQIRGNILLSANSDGTLAAYETRKRKLFVRSEPLSSELLSIVVTDRFTYVGSGSGYMEIFKDKEYGNILKRIKCTDSVNIDCLQLLRSNLILTASNNTDIMRFVHLSSSEILGSSRACEGGVQQLSVNADNSWLIVLSCIEPSFKFSNLPALLDENPCILTKLKSSGQTSRIPSKNFFNGIINNL